MIHQIYKQLGETPLEALERCRSEHNIGEDTPMTFAGRLDPMAEGVMVVLSGGDVHRKEEFLHLDKTYELDVLWGIQTDTYDLLGIPQSQSIFHSHPVRNFFKYLRSYLFEERVNEEEIKRWVGTFRQPYPPFSSKTVQGKPLWQWAREGRISEITVPTKKVTIYRIEEKDNYTVSGTELIDTINKRLDLVSGDFRQDEIREAWKDFLADTSSMFHVSSFTIHCSSGTYMRSLAHNLGGCAFAIRRTKVEGFNL